MNVQHASTVPRNVPKFSVNKCLRLCEDKDKMTELGEGYAATIWSREQFSCILEHWIEDRKQKESTVALYSVSGAHVLTLYKILKCSWKNFSWFSITHEIFLTLNYFRTSVVTLLKYFVRKKTLYSFKIVYTIKC